LFLFTDQIDIFMVPKSNLSHLELYRATVNDYGKLQSCFPNLEYLTLWNVESDDFLSMATATNLKTLILVDVSRNLSAAPLTRFCAARKTPLNLILKFIYLKRDRYRFNFPNIEILRQTLTPMITFT